MTAALGGFGLKEITYGIREEIYCLGDARRAAFGIVAYANAEIDGTVTVVAEVGDVTGKRQEIERLVRLCNRVRLSPEMLRDLVCDFL